MVILLAVGVGVVLLGALVLLRFPDRPGGKVAFQGMEVSSLGAGLPLVALGVAAIAFGASGLGGSAPAETATDRVGGGVSRAPGGEQARVCLADIENDVDDERVIDVEVGAQWLAILFPQQSKTEPFALRLTDNGDPVAGMVLRYFPENLLFRVQSFSDVECRALDIARLTPPEPPSDIVQSGSDYGFDLADRSYLLNLNGGAEVRVTFGFVNP